MAKFYGPIGYAKLTETKPGVWQDVITEHDYFGDITRNTSRTQSSGDVNDDVNVSNELSIIADPYAISNFHNMRYVELWGTKWKISKVDVQYPRLKLTLGGVYNG